MRKLLLLALMLTLTACSSGPKETKDPAPNAPPKWFSSYSPRPGSETTEQRIVINTSSDPSKLNFGLLRVEDVTYGADLSPQVAIQSTRSEDGTYAISIRHRDGGNLFPAGSEIRVTVDGYSWTFKSVAK